MPDEVVTPPNHPKAGSAEPDKELAAIQTVLSALQHLEKDARQRVLDYVFVRLGIRAERAAPVLTAPVTTPSSSSQQPTTSVTDIRTLTQQKKPRNSVEMAILVGYYLAEVAPPHERKTEITSDDITRYFKQAGFKLPKRGAKTLFDARKSGYMDGGSSTGAYKLNPVGFNLVTHVLPPKK
jgi:hypothetical protein